MGGAGGRGPDVPVPDRRTLLGLDEETIRRAETGVVDRTDVRALVAEVRRLRAALATAEAARDQARAERDAANLQCARAIRDLDEIRTGTVWFLSPEET